MTPQPGFATAPPFYPQQLTGAANARRQAGCGQSRPARLGKSATPLHVQADAAHRPVRLTAADPRGDRLSGRRPGGGR
jgi:hypothetical protein